MARNYAALLHEYLEEMDALSDAEFGRLCRALLKYSMTGKEVQLQGAEKFLLKRVYMQERRFQESYKRQIEAKREAGKRGAFARWGTDANDSTAIANDSTAMAGYGENGQTETETETETNSPKGGGKGRARKPRFTPPTLEEVAAFVQERGSKVDPQGFIDFYASKGWMVGKTPMKDWKAACRNAEHWERWNQPAKGKAKGQPSGYGPGVDYQPSPERIEENDRELEEFLKQQHQREAERENSAQAPK